MNNMAFVRPFGQAPQGASPWTAGMPPGLQQPQLQAQAPQQHQGAAQVPQQMFNQPMGAFDITGGGGFAQTGPAQLAPAPGQWAQPIQAMQAPIQFVTNSGPFMQQPMQPQHMQQRFHPQQQLQHQQQRSMHQQQRSLSASRVGGSQNYAKRANNQNNSFGGSQWQPNRQQQQNNANNNNNNNNNDQFKRSGRPQPRPQQQNQQQNQQQPQKGQQNRVNPNSSNNANNSNNTNKQQQQQNQQKQQQQQQQQTQQQGVKKGPVKVTKAAKKQAVAKANKVSKPQTGVDKVQGSAEKSQQQQQQADKPQSKTAERKQFKLQARKNAEELKFTKMPVIKATKAINAAAAAGKPDGLVADDTPIDQSQLKCVPAVFGFVCKACDVFLRDRFARREHIDSESHMEKFKVFEAEQQRLASEKTAANATSATATATTTSTEVVANVIEVKSEPKAEAQEAPKATPDATPGVADLEPKLEQQAPANDDAKKEDDK